MIFDECVDRILKESAYADSFFFGYLSDDVLQDIAETSHNADIKFVSVILTYTSSEEVSDVVVNHVFDVRVAVMLQYEWGEAAKVARW